MNNANSKLKLACAYIGGARILWDGKEIPPYEEPSDLYRLMQDIRKYSVITPNVVPAKEFVDREACC